MNYTHMWEVYLTLENERKKVYAVVRVRDFTGYPDAPHLEGQMTVYKGAKDADPS